MKHSKKRFNFPQNLHNQCKVSVLRDWVMLHPRPCLPLPTPLERFTYADLHKLHKPSGAHALNYMEC